MLEQQVVMPADDPPTHPPTSYTYTPLPRSCSNQECEMLEQRVVMPAEDSAVLVRKRVAPPSALKQPGGACRAGAAQGQNSRGAAAGGSSRVGGRDVVARQRGARR